MQAIVIKRALLCGAALSSLLLGACAAQPKTLYNWGSYQQQVYESFKDAGSSPQAQIDALEADMQKAQAKGEALPPGFHAHLAMLYGKVGATDQFKQKLEAEKTLYPESQTFVDFMLSKFKN